MGEREISPILPLTHSPFLKQWRDQLLRSLHSQGRIHEASRYTRFIDEKLSESISPEVIERYKKQWSEKLEKFLSDLKTLYDKGQATQPHIANLLNAQHAMPPFSVPAGWSKDFREEELLEKSQELLLSPRAEMRMKPRAKDETFSPRSLFTAGVLGLAAGLFLGNSGTQTQILPVKRPEPVSPASSPIDLTDEGLRKVKTSQLLVEIGFSLDTALERFKLDRMLDSEENNQAVEQIIAMALRRALILLERNHTEIAAALTPFLLVPEPFVEEELKVRHILFLARERKIDPNLILGVRTLLEGIENRIPQNQVLEHLRQDGITLETLDLKLQLLNNVRGQNRIASRRSEARLPREQLREAIQEAEEKARWVYAGQAMNSLHVIVGENDWYQQFNVELNKSLTSLRTEITTLSRTGNKAAELNKLGLELKKILLKHAMAFAYSLMRQLEHSRGDIFEFENKLKRISVSDNLDYRLNEVDELIKEIFLTTAITLLRTEGKDLSSVKFFILYLAYLRHYEPKNFRKDSTEQSRIGWLDLVYRAKTWDDLRKLVTQPQLNEKSPLISEDVDFVPVVEEVKIPFETLTWDQFPQWFNEKRKMIEGIQIVRVRVGDRITDYDMRHTVLNDEVSEAETDVQFYNFLGGLIKKGVENEGLVEELSQRSVNVKIIQEQRFHREYIEDINVLQININAPNETRAELRSEQIGNSPSRSEMRSIDEAESTDAAIIGQGDEMQEIEVELQGRGISPIDPRFGDILLLMREGKEIPEHMQRLTTRRAGSHGEISIATVEYQHKGSIEKKSISPVSHSDFKRQMITPIVKKVGEGTDGKGEYAIGLEVTSPRSGENFIMVSYVLVRNGKIRLGKLRKSNLEFNGKVLVEKMPSTSKSIVKEIMNGVANGNLPQKYRRMSLATLQEYKLLSPNGKAIYFWSKDKLDGGESVRFQLPHHLPVDSIVLTIDPVDINREDGDIETVWAATVWLDEVKDRATGAVSRPAIPIKDMILYSPSQGFTYQRPFPEAHVGFTHVEREIPNVDRTFKDLIKAKWYLYWLANHIGPTPDEDTIYVESQGGTPSDPYLYNFKRKTVAVPLGPKFSQGKTTRYWVTFGEGKRGVRYHNSVTGVNKDFLLFSNNQSSVSDLKLPDSDTEFTPPQDAAAEETASSFVQKPIAAESEMVTEPKVEIKSEIGVQESKIETKEIDALSLTEEAWKALLENPPPQLFEIIVSSYERIMEFKEKGQEEEAQILLNRTLDVLLLAEPTESSNASAEETIDHAYYTSNYLYLDPNVNLAEVEKYAARAHKLAEEIKDEERILTIKPWLERVREEIEQVKEQKKAAEQAAQARLEAQQKEQAAQKKLQDLRVSIQSKLKQLGTDFNQVEDLRKSSGLLQELISLNIPQEFTALLKQREILTSVWSAYVEIRREINAFNPERGKLFFADKQRDIQAFYRRTKASGLKDKLLDELSDLESDFNNQTIQRQIEDLEDDLQLNQIKREILQARLSTLLKRIRDSKVLNDDMRTRLTAQIAPLQLTLFPPRRSESGKSSPRSESRFDFVFDYEFWAVAGPIGLGILYYLGRIAFSFPDLLEEIKLDRKKAKETRKRMERRERSRRLEAEKLVTEVIKQVQDTAVLNPNAEINTQKSREVFSKKLTALIPVKAILDEVDAIEQIKMFERQQKESFGGTSYLYELPRSEMREEGENSIQVRVAGQQAMEQLQEIISAKRSEMRNESNGQPAMAPESHTLALQKKYGKIAKLFKKQRAGKLTNSVKLKEDSEHGMPFTQQETMMGLKRGLNESLTKLKKADSYQGGFTEVIEALEKLMIDIDARNVDLAGINARSIQWLEDFERLLQNPIFRTFAPKEGVVGRIILLMSPGQYRRKAAPQAEFPTDSSTPNEIGGYFYDYGKDRYFRFTENRFLAFNDLLQNWGVIAEIIPSAEEYKDYTEWVLPWVILDWEKAILNYQKRKDISSGIIDQLLKLIEQYRPHENEKIAELKQILINKESRANRKRAEARLIQAPKFVVAEYNGQPLQDIRLHKEEDFINVIKYFRSNGEVRNKALQSQASENGNRFIELFYPSLSELEEGKEIPMQLWFNPAILFEGSVEEAARKFQNLIMGYALSQTKLKFFDETEIRLPLLEWPKQGRIAVYQDKSEPDYLYFRIEVTKAEEIRAEVRANDAPLTPVLSSKTSHRSREQWLDEINALIEQLPPDQEIAFRDIARVSEGKLSANQIESAFANHKLYQNIPRIKKRQVAPAVVPKKKPLPVIVPEVKKPVKKDEVAEQAFSLWSELNKDVKRNLELSRLNKFGDLVWKEIPYYGRTRTPDKRDKLNERIMNELISALHLQHLRPGLTSKLDPIRYAIDNATKHAVRKKGARAFVVMLRTDKSIYSMVLDSGPGIADVESAVNVKELELGETRGVPILLEDALDADGEGFIVTVSGKNHVFGKKQVFKWVKDELPGQGTLVLIRLPFEITPSDSNGRPQLKNGEALITLPSSEETMAVRSEARAIRVEAEIGPLNFPIHVRPSAILTTPPVMEFNQIDDLTISFVVLNGRVQEEKRLSAINLLSHATDFMQGSKMKIYVSSTRYSEPFLKRIVEYIKFIFENYNPDVEELGGSGVLDNIFDEDKKIKLEKDLAAMGLNMSPEIYINMNNAVERIAGIRLGGTNRIADWINRNIGTQEAFASEARSELRKMMSDESYVRYAVAREMGRDKTYGRLNSILRNNGISYQKFQEIKKVEFDRALDQFESAIDESVHMAVVFEYLPEMKDELSQLILSQVQRFSASGDILLKRLKFPLLSDNKDEVLAFIRSLPSEARSVVQYHPDLDSLSEWFKNNPKFGKAYSIFTQDNTQAFLENGFPVERLVRSKVRLIDAMPIVPRIADYFSRTTKPTALGLLNTLPESFSRGAIGYNNNGFFISRSYLDSMLAQESLRQSA